VVHLHLHLPHLQPQVLLLTRFALLFKKRCRKPKAVVALALMVSQRAKVRVK
jgi:hypothetical protein